MANKENLLPRNGDVEAVIPYIARCGLLAERIGGRALDRDQVVALLNTLEVPPREDVIEAVFEEAEEMRPKFFPQECAS